MRTTAFVEKHLFNDTFSQEDTSFRWNGKGWAKSKLKERQRERESERPLLRKGCGVDNKLYR
jgi:hypothetical protein